LFDHIPDRYGPSKYQPGNEPNNSLEGFFVSYIIAVGGAGSSGLPAFESGT
jgi:hypothetical protein